MTTDVFARYAEMDPVLDEKPAWEAIDAAVLAAIDRRTDLMTTQLESTTQPMPRRRRWTGAWVAAAAFAAVVAIGIIAVLATTRSEEPVDIPAPPFATAMEALDALGLAIEHGTAQDIHALLAEDYTGYWIIGPTVAETDERLRFDRALGTVSEIVSCAESSPRSAHCVAAMSLLDNQVLRGTDTTDVEITVRIDEDGYISSSSRRFTGETAPPFDLSEDFWRWIADQGLSPFDLVPDADQNALMTASPEEAAERYRDLLARFMEERG